MNKRRTHSLTGQVISPLIALLLATTTLLAACGGGTDRTKAQLRLVNASGGYAQLDMRVDDQLRQGSVGYGGTEGYVEVDPDDAETQITSASSPTSLLRFTPTVSERRYYTVLAYGAAGALRHHVLDDNAGEPADNRALLRVVNAAPDAGPLDVYLTASGETLDSAVALQSSAAYGVVGGWIPVNSGTWRLRVTAPGAKGDVRLDLPAISLPSKHITTVVLTPSAGGALVNGLLLAQRSSITRADASHARVRLVAGTTEPARVAANVGTTPLVPEPPQGGAREQDSPSIGEYVLVPVGTGVPGVLVNGAAAPGDSKPLEAGRDYTLLVIGPASAARATWLDDDNRVASDGTRAKVRLVNGLAEAGAALSMTVDLRPAGSGVAQGVASGYTTLAPTIGSGDGDIRVTSSNPAGVVYGAQDRVMQASRVYSVFVLGSQAAPKGLLNRDR